MNLRFLGVLRCHSEMGNKGERSYLREKYQEVNGLDCFPIGESLLLKVFEHKCFYKGKYEKV